MAEYYPLLAKAIAGLPNPTPEMRRAVYERARKALLAQLLSLEPPLAEAAVGRETDALDSAVARLEAELGARDGPASEKPQAAEPAVSMPDVRERTAPPPVSPVSGKFTPPRKPSGFTTQGGPSPVAKPPALTPSGATPPPIMAPMTPSVARQDSAESAAESAGAPRERRDAGVPERPAQKVKAPAAQATAPQTRDGPGAESPASSEHESFAGPQKPRLEGLRVYAPQRDVDEGRGSFRLWIVGGIVAVVVAIVAVAAWTLRDRPDRLAHLKAPVLIKPEQSGKIVERVGGEAKQPETQPEPSQGTQAVAPAAVPPAPSAEAPATTTATAPATAASPAPQASDAGQTIPVAQRAALLVEAPNEPNKVKTYLGTVVWRLDNVSGGAGQPLGTAVRADIDVPGDKLKVALTLQKNMDASLPASHTITIVFTLQPDSPTGGVKQINVPQLRLDDAPTGDSLIGVPVPIMENSFLIGLSRGSAEATNLLLIKQRAWFDVPVLLGNGHIAKLTFEKGTSGTRAIDDAISAWQAQ